MKRHLAPFTRLNTCNPYPRKLTKLVSSRMEALALLRKNNEPFPTKASRQPTSDKTHRDLKSIMVHRPPRSRLLSPSPRTLRSTLCRESSALTNPLSWVHRLASTKIPTRSHQSQYSGATVPSRCLDRSASLTSVSSRHCTRIWSVKATTERRKQQYQEVKNLQ